MKTISKTTSIAETPAVGSAWIGWVLALCATFAFSLAPPVARGAIVDGMDPTALLVARFVISVLLFAVTTALTDPQQFKMPGRGLWFVSAAGLFNGVAMLSFFWALTRLEASMASMIMSLLPLVVLLLLALRGEKFTRRNAVRVTLALGGVYLLIGPGGQVDLVGVMLMLVAVMLFAAQLVIIQWYLQSYDTRTVALYLAVAMTVVIGAFWVVQGAEWHNPGVQGWWAILILSVASTYLARMLFYAAIRYLGSGQIVMLMPVEMLLSIAWAVLLLDERFTPVQAVGGVLILISASLAIRRLGTARWRPRWRFLTRA